MKNHPHHKHFGNDPEHGGINGGTKPPPGANRPKPSKPTPSRATRSSAEPAYGKGIKRRHARYKP